MRTGHLFAGAGGGILADLILGHTPIFAVEWDAYCCQVLRERVEDGWFPGMQVFEGDVRLFNASDWKGRVDCIHAGFPCQDISVAGNQAGVGEGTRSGLYREVLRCADEIRPRYIFLENVSAILSNGLGTVLGDLAARGYDCRWCCLRASDVGAPHHRDRWWCLAYASEKRLQSTEEIRELGRKRFSKHGDGKTIIVPNTAGARWGEDGAWEFRGETTWWEIEPDVGRVVNGMASKLDKTNDQAKQWEEGGTKSGETHEMSGMRIKGKAPSSSQGQESHKQYPGESVGSLPGVSYKGTQGDGRLGPRECPPGEMPDLRETIPTIEESAGQSLRERMFERERAHGGQKTVEWWEVEPNIGRVVNGLDSRVDRLKALGNGQVPLQAAIAWKILSAGLL